MKQAQSKYIILEKFVTRNRSHKLLKPIGVAIHETANPGATAMNHYKYFNSGDRKALAHLFVDWTDKDYIVQLAPLNEQTWHAGSAKGNSSFISVEMCRPKTFNKEQFNIVWERTVWLCAYLFINEVKINKVTETNLMSHDEMRIKFGGTTHTDPTALFKEYGVNMSKFRQAVQDEINIQLKGREDSYMVFKDESKIASWAKDSVMRVADLGLIKGDGNGNFNPKNPITREEFAVVLDRLLTLQKKEGLK